MENVIAVSALKMTRFSDQVNIILISKLISDFSLFKYFNGTAISTFAQLVLLILFVKLGLNSNDPKSFMSSLRSNLGVLNYTSSCSWIIIALLY